MSTNAAILRFDGEGYTGRYHHWDGYPSGLGRALWHHLHGHFNMDVAAMLKFLIDDHPAGWSTIVRADLNLLVGYRNHRPYEPDAPRHPECYCHGDRSEPAMLLTDQNADESGCEWLYLFRDNTMQIVRPCSCCHNSKPIATIQLDGPEPDWNQFD